jgi:hypothetical protein
MGQPIRKFTLTIHQPIPLQPPKPQLPALRNQAAAKIPTVTPNTPLCAKIAPVAVVLFLHAQSFAILRALYHNPTANLNFRLNISLHHNINLNLSTNHHLSAATLPLPLAPPSLRTAHTTTSHPMPHIRINHQIKPPIKAPCTPQAPYTPTNHQTTRTTANAKAS